MTEEQAHTGSQLGVAEVEALTVELFEQVSYYCSVLLIAELIICLGTPSYTIAFHGSLQQEGIHWLPRQRSKV